MKSIRYLLALLILTVPEVYADSDANAATPFDYFAENRQMVRNGVQAVLTCNGLFTSNRSLEHVQAEELAYLTEDRFGGIVTENVDINPDSESVQVGGGKDGIAITAVFRPGIGCVVMAPNQTLAEIDALPQLQLDAELQATASKRPWPQGDKLPRLSWPKEFNQDKLQAASDRVFAPGLDNQVTLSLLVVHKGQIIHERYREGVDQTTRTRTWSTAKSIAATLVGQLVDEQKLGLDTPLSLTWLPEVKHPGTDPRHPITLRHVLHMSSGLDPVDSFNKEYATGSGLAYWAGASSAQGALNRALLYQPGTYWDYENYDTLLAVMAMKQALNLSAQDYLAYPHSALLQRIGMHNTLLSTDRFGDFILSSQVYTNARDLARFGLLYLNNGIWAGERILSEAFINFVRTPAPASAVHGNFYGGQFWLVPDGRTDVPKSAYSTAGNRGQYVIILPEQDLVIVRRGLDYARPHMNRWDIAAWVLEAMNEPQ